jgi:hypothetical protein
MTNNTTPQINQRFIKTNAGLVLTIILGSQEYQDGNGETFFILTFDNNEKMRYYTKNNTFTTTGGGQVEIKPFILEEDKLYLTIEGYEHEFKTITDENNKITYVSDEGSQYSSDGKVILSDGFSSFFMIAGESNDYVKSVLHERKFKQSDQKLLFAEKFGRNSKVLTKKQAQKMFQSKGTVITHTRRNNNKEVFFFSDNHMFGYIDEKNKLDFAPFTHFLFPTKVVARPGLESGYITNIDEFIFIFHNGNKLLSTEQELYEYLEQNPDAYKVN